MTWKAKTDTNALPFNGKICLYPFNVRLNGSHKRLNAFLIRLLKSCMRLTILVKRFNACLIRLKNEHPFNILDKTFLIRLTFWTKRFLSV